MFVLRSSLCRMTQSLRSGDGISYVAGSSFRTNRVRLSAVCSFRRTDDARPRKTLIIRCFSSSTQSSLSASLASLASTCFSSSVGSLVDLSEYLMNGCNWTDAPKCPDYVGPVSIAQTGDGRGRGLYATTDVTAGDAIIISNAFAASYNDTHSIELFTKISELVQNCPRALRQFYSLGGYDYHDDMEAPNVKLFDLSACYSDDGHPHPPNLEYDEKRIVHIINVNSFEGELPSQNSQEETRLTGLWLLPSFINHCCSPNASRLVVGEAMLIIASRDIRVNEEITISYTDSMSPLKRREDNLAAMGYGFCCQCKRCVAERSVQEELKGINEGYFELYDKVSDEVYSAVTTGVRPCVDKSSACMKLFDLYHGLRKKLSSFGSLTKLEQQWILGGYSSAYLGKWLVSGYGTGFSPGSDFVDAAAMELVEAMKVTVPGMLRTLSFITILVTASEKEEGRLSDVVDSLVYLGLDECIRVYGKQRLDVTMKLMEQSADVVPFF